MKSGIVLAGVLAAGLGLGTAQAAPPPAKTMKVSITAPTAPTAATIEITKASKAQVKVSTGNVTFALKLNGVNDIPGGTPTNSTGNTFSVQFLVGGVTHNKDFVFDLANGKTSPTATLKFAVSNSDAGTWGSALSAGTPIEFRRFRVIENATGEDFGVMGITTQ
jgi:hypothetical protein